ncbi:MAG: class I tRNA ligase family protein, partial [Alistipes sp.]|nr:class I tRNA ligase family protein [Alistipes sp.]
DFIGCYLEMVKPAYQSPIDAETMAATKHFFDELLRLLHPFMPFVTEEIWQDLAPEADCESIVVARQPQVVKEADERLLARFDLAREVISSIRNVRKQKNIAQKDALTMSVITDENYPSEYAPVIAKLGNLSSVDAVTEKDASAAAFIVKTTQYFIPLGDKIDREAERKKLSADLEYYEGFLASVMKKLSNERFVQSAPEKVVANERAKQADAEAKIAAIKEQLKTL